LQVLMEHQREIQRVNYRRHIGEIIEVMVEAQNAVRAQWIGRTSQNKTLNFSVPAGVQPEIGSYHQVRVTQAFPNSLAGEFVAQS
jgi:tRNA-2-methylthio-N6-dimethylallyladenosine synthase